MQKKHWLGIPELDVQHEEIYSIISSLIEAAESNDKWQLVHYILVRLHELLRIHFAVEESVMRLIEFPELHQHKEMHKDLMDRVGQLKNDALTGKNTEGIDLKAKHDFVLHILDHDVSFAEFLKAQFPNAFSGGLGAA